MMIKLIKKGPYACMIDLKVLSTDSQALLYGTSTTFMTYACVPEVSDNVASILFPEKGAEFHGLCRQAVKQCLVAAR